MTLDIMIVRQENVCYTSFMGNHRANGILIVALANLIYQIYKGKKK